MEAREVVGKYRIARKLGQGGMGSVFEAVDEKIKSHVALKILNLQCSQNIQVVMRFLNEAQIANSIRHPGIVKVYDHGFLPSGEAYLAMELLQGVSLRERMRQGCSEADVIRWARQTASALAAAHDLGVVHREPKIEKLRSRNGSCDATLEIARNEVNSRTYAGFSTERSKTTTSSGDTAVSAADRSERLVPAMAVVGALPAMAAATTPDAALRSMAMVECRPRKLWGQTLGTSARTQYRCGRSHS